MKYLIAVLLVAAVALLSGPPRADAATFYVNNASGSCSNTGAGTQAQPYCTITAALSAHHAAGTTIIVLPGTYKEQVNIPGSGASGSPLVLQGQGTPSNPVIVDGSNSSGTPTNSFNINVAGVSWVVIDGFTVTKSVWDGIYVSNSSNVTVTNNVATFGQHYGIEAANSTATTIGSNTVHDNLWSGIALTGGSTGCTIQDNETYHNLTANQSSGIYDYGSPHNLIQRNRTHDNAYNGIMNTTGAIGNVMRENRSWNNQHQGLEDIFCTGNYHTGDVSYHNGWNGFAIEGGATGTTTYNCVAFDNGQSTGNTNFEVDAQSTSGNTSNDNLWWNSYGGTIIKFGGNNYSTVSSFASATGEDTRTKQGDPKFANAANGDFRPLAGSPLIDCANSGVANWLSTDAAGNARADDPATPNTGLGPVTFADRGALEYQPSGGGGNQPPVAKLKLTPSSGIAPLAVTADGSGSTDPEGGRIFTYKFDFGDGTVVGPQSGKTATHTYSAVGTWLATLTVTDSVGATGTATAPDTVRAPGNQPPIAALKLSPTSGLVPLPVTADASGSRDPEGGRIASYRFDFGDGTVVGPQAGATAAHTYSTAGTWLASVTVTDSIGATGSASAPDTVIAPGNKPPVAKIVATPPFGVGPLLVTLDGSGSTDPEGGRIASYLFNFGDGTPTVGPQAAATASHNYTSLGKWLASVTVTDSVGATGTASTIVEVTSAPALGTYYVDGSSATCSPTGPGTQANPFCTITAALAAQHAPGTTIIVMPGVYREQVTMPAAGLPGNPITLQAQAAPGNPVVIDGADDFANPALWTLSSGTVWLAASVTWSPVQVFADSVRLAVSTAAPASLPVNSFVYVAGQGLYVNLGTDSPGNHHAEVGHQSYGVYISGRTYVTVDGFTSTRSEQAGIEITNLSNNVTATHNSTVFSGGYGIQVNNASACVAGANVVSDNLKSGIGVTGGSTGCTIQDNETFRNVTASQSCGIYDYGSPGNLIQRNNVHDNAYTGVKMIGAAINNVLVQNRSWKNGHYGFQDVSSTGNAHVGDVANGNQAFGFDVENIATGTSLFDCVSTDNVGGNLQVDATSVTGFSSNDNLFWSLAGGTVVKYNGVSYPTVLAYSTASTQDTRTLQADPKFTSTATGDFHPLAGSPLIDNANSGVPNWPATDAAGNARFDDPATANTGLGPVAFADRGAFEFGSGPAPVAGAAALQGGTGQPTDDASLRVHGLAPSVAPNPIRSTASIAFRLDRPTTVRIRVFDLVGRLVRTLPTSTSTNAGWNVAVLDGRTDDGAPLRSGIYMYEIQAGGERAVGRFVVMR